MFLPRYILVRNLDICWTFFGRVGYLGTRPELKMLASQDESSNFENDEWLDDSIEHEFLI